MKDIERKESMTPRWWIGCPKVERKDSQDKGNQEGKTGRITTEKRTIFRQVTIFRHIHVY